MKERNIKNNTLLNNDQNVLCVDNHNNQHGCASMNHFSSKMDLDFANFIVFILFWTTKQTNNFIDIFSIVVANSQWSVAL